MWIAIKGLISSGAHIDIQDKHGETPLYLAFNEIFIGLKYDLLRD